MNYDYDVWIGTYREHIYKSKKKLQIGGSDACQGDSGSPLIKWQRIRKNRQISQKAYLIGIVSRGEGCAYYDLPGIYTRYATSYGNFSNSSFPQSKLLAGLDQQTYGGRYLYLCLVYVYGIC